MNLLFDHHLSPRLVKSLADLYPDSSHVYLIGLDKADDPAIWEYARANDFVIVSKDSDFNDLSVLRGFPPKVVWLKLGNCTTREAEDAIRRYSDTIAEFAADPISRIMEIRHS
jgi:predicted nuclease of predicted toxin-antitoxin system